MDKGFSKWSCLASLGSVIKVEKNSCTDIIKYLGLCTWYSQWWKNGSHALVEFCASPLPPTFFNLQSLRSQGRSNVHALNRGVRGQPRPHTLLCSFISSTHPFYHCSKTHSVDADAMPDLCPVMEMQRERAVNVEHEEIRTKARERVGWKKPGFWVRRSESDSRLITARK